ncbi:hypothetical protein [Uliginosibacterium gangwonense]|uniref:hypothetical protein n=1 Tax=Uliginosibacterium gangwonense TaxID=392736 RepID=UPI0012FB6507|nr:hypothetical protein [Uliginosibacterium gangwonense]
MERRYKLALIGVGVSVLAHWVVLDWMRTPQQGGLPPGLPLQVELRPKVQPGAGDEVEAPSQPVLQGRPHPPDDERQPTRQQVSAPTARAKASAGSLSAFVKSAQALDEGQGPAPEVSRDHGWRALTDEEAQVMVRLRLASMLADEQLRLDAPVTLQLRRGAGGVPMVDAVGGAADTVQTRRLVEAVRQRLGQQSDLLPPGLPLPIDIECLPN